MEANFQSGNYGNAAGWVVTWVSSTVEGVVSGKTSTRAQAGFRAARVAAAEGKVLSNNGVQIRRSKRKLGRLVEKERFHWWTKGIEPKPCFTPMKNLLPAKP